MKITNDEWFHDILACPECENKLIGQYDPTVRECSNESCDFRASIIDRVYDLRPKDLDSHQIAENKWREDHIGEMAKLVNDLDQESIQTYNLLNRITYYFFTSQYAYIRDKFFPKNHLAGKGLEIGGSTGHISGFMKLFYPETLLVTSDVAHVNITNAIYIADSLNLKTDYFVLADAERLPFLPNSFDFLLSSGMLHHVGDVHKTLEQGHKLLHPGGKWYIFNELSIGSIPRMYWNSRFGEKGKMARLTGIHEKSYTFKDWVVFFEKAGFKLLDTHFDRDPAYKLVSWSKALYYKIILKLPLALIRAGIPSSVGFILEKPKNNSSNRAS